MTTVHPLQVLDEAIPETGHDFSVDLIITTRDLIRCGPPRRPAGLDWDELPASMIAAIPVLAARAAHEAAGQLRCPICGKPAPPGVRGSC